MPILVIFILASQSIGLGKQFPWSLLPWDLGRYLWVVVTLAVLTVAAYEPFRRKLSAKLPEVSQKVWVWKLLVLANAPFLLYSAWRFKEFGYTFPWPQLVLIAAAASLIKRDKLGLAILFSLALQFCAIFNSPLNDLRSDMLPVIQAALTQWHQGVSPYAMLSLPGLGPDRMPYLPGTLVSHWPAWALGIDLRFGQLFFRALWMGALLLRLRRKPNSAGSDLVQVFALNPYLNFRHDMYFEFFLALIAFYWLYPTVRWLSIPALVVTRQWAWVLAPFAAVDWVRRGPRLKRAALLTLGSAGIFGALVLLLKPSTDLHTFIEAIFAFQSWITFPVFKDDYGLTLVPVFYKAGLSSWLQIIQGTVCLSYFAYGVIFQRKALVKYGTLCLVIFITFNPHFWNYFWFSPALWIIASQLGDEKSTSPA